MARFAPVKVVLWYNERGGEADTDSEPSHHTTDVSPSGDVNVCVSRREMAWKRIVQWPPCPLCPQTRFIFIVHEDSNRSGVCSNVPFVLPREFLSSALSAYCLIFRPGDLRVSENTLWGWILKDRRSIEKVEETGLKWKDLKSSFESTKKNRKWKLNVRTYVFGGRKVGRRVQDRNLVDSEELRKGNGRDSRWNFESRGKESKDRDSEENLYLYLHILNIFIFIPIYFEYIYIYIFIF